MVVVVVVVTFLIKKTKIILLIINSHNYSYKKNSLEEYHQNIPYALDRARILTAQNKHFSEFLKNIYSGKNCFVVYYM